MSKTFKSVALPNVSVSIKQSSDGVRICSVHGPDVANVTVAPSDAPALALSILEAAGVTRQGPDFLAGAVESLQLHLDEQERATAEAKEQAALEAEALELLNAEREEFNCTPVRDLSEVPARDQRAAIAVARRAREIGGRAEK